LNFIHSFEDAVSEYVILISPEYTGNENTEIDK